MSEENEPVFSRRALVTAGGAACGLLAGIVAAQAVAFSLWAAGRAGWAEAAWQVFSPLLALAGALAGAWIWRRLFSERAYLALASVLAVAAVLLSVCAWLGFPWIGEG